MAYDTELADRIRAILSDRTDVTEKAMFGGLAFLVDGHMAIAAGSNRGLLARVDPAEAAGLLAEPGVEPMVMRGREMTGWLSVTLDPDVSDAVLRAWVDRGLDVVAALD